MSVKQYELWVVNVQKDVKPYSYEKVRLLAQLSQGEANKIWETSIKHPHISEGVIWLSFKQEKKYGINAMTFCYLEDYQWVKV